MQVKVEEAVRDDAPSDSESRSLYENEVAGHLCMSFSSVFSASSWATLRKCSRSMAPLDLSTGRNGKSNIVPCTYVRTY